MQLDITVPSPSGMRAVAQIHDIVCVEMRQCLGYGKIHEHLKYAHHCKAIEKTTA